MRETKAKRDAFDDDDYEKKLSTFENATMTTTKKEKKEGKSWSFNARISSTSNCSHLNLYYIYFIISPQVYACNKREAKNTIKIFLLLLLLFFASSKRGFLGERARLFYNPHTKNRIILMGPLKILVTFFKYIC